MSSMGELGAAARAQVEVALDELDLRFASLRLVAPHGVARLKAAIEREGVRNPVLASTAVEAGRRVLLDGLKRLRVARDLGIPKLWATLVALDAPASLAAMLAANAPHAGLTAIEQGWIARHLCREHGLTQKQTGELVGHDQSWVSIRIRLVENLDERRQEDLRLGLLSPAQARELSRLPRGSQQEHAAQAIQEHGLSSRKTADLVRLVLGTDQPRVRHELLDDPLRYLAQANEARVQPTMDPRLSRAGQQLARVLTTWQTTSGHLERILAGTLSAEDALLLRPPLEQAVAAGRRALALIEAARRTTAQEDGPVQAQP